MDTTQPFLCQHPPCIFAGKQRDWQEVKVCTYAGCIGKMKLAGTFVPRKQPPLARPGFYLLAFAGVLAAGGLYLALQEPTRVVPSPPTPAPLIVTATPVPLPRVSIRFEVDTAIAHAERLLDLHLKLNVAEATADTKARTGQSVTGVGRTGDQALGQSKQTFAEQKMFADLAEQRRNDITIESGRYTTALQRLASFPREVILEEFKLAQNEKRTLPTKAQLTVELAFNHWQQAAIGRMPRPEVLFSEFKLLSLRDP